MQGLQLICFDNVIVSLKYFIFRMKLKESGIIATDEHGIKMRRQKKDWTSAYAKVTKARGEENKGEASFLDLSSLAYFAS